MNTTRAIAAAPPNRPLEKQALAIDPSLGSIYLCGHCESIHLAVGELHLKLDRESFFALASLLSRAATNLAARPVAFMPPLSPGMVS